MSDETPAPDLGALLSQLGQVRSSLEAAQESAAAQVVEGRAGGGAVRVELSGAWEFRRVQIAPSVIDPDQVEMLQDLVLAAVRDAAEQVARAHASALGGLDLGGGLQGLLGP